MYTNLKAIRLGDFVKIISIDLKTSENLKDFERLPKNSDKLKNNLIRAKNKIIDIGLANDFSYYFTVTYSTKYDRYNLDVIYNLFRKHIRFLNKHCDGSIKYLVVPEQHKDGAWHLHGFFNKGIEQFFFTNKHGHLDISSLCDLGWVNVQVIQNKIKISHYITKYVAKNLGKNISVRSHCYYASTGLKKGVELINVVYNNEDFNNNFFDFKSVYCYKKILTLEEYNKVRLKLLTL